MGVFWFQRHKRQQDQDRVKARNIVEGGKGPPVRLVKAHAYGIHCKRQTPDEQFKAITDFCALWMFEPDVTVVVVVERYILYFLKGLRSLNRAWVAAARDGFGRSVPGGLV
jgi:hypothetical protein